MNIKELTDKIVEDGLLTQEEYQLFMAKIDEDNITDPDEAAQIRRVLKMIQRKELKVELPK